MRILFALGLLASTSAASAQVVSEMTPAAIKQAIDEGKDGCYNLTVGRLGGIRTTVGCFTTPYSRVVGAALYAKKRYQPFADKDVTPDLVAPELVVHAWPQHRREGAGLNSVVAVVIAPKGGKDTAAVIRPTKSETTTTEAKNLLGATFEGEGITATFPLSALAPGNEVRVVYEEPGACPTGGFGKGKPECVVELKPDKVK